MNKEKKNKEGELIYLGIHKEEKPTYSEWKGYLLEKQNLEREYHTIIPMRKAEIRLQIANLEKLVMGVPDFYWSDYIKECKK